MTKEQEGAIEILENISEYGLSCVVTEENQQVIKTVLNLIQEKDIQIIEAKEANRQLSVELEKKDKEKQEWKKAYYEIKEKTSGIPNSINR